MIIIITRFYVDNCFFSSPQKYLLLIFSIERYLNIHRSSKNRFYYRLSNQLETQKPNIFVSIIRSIKLHLERK